MSSRTNLQGHVTVPESVVDIRAALCVAHSVASDKRGVARSHGRGVTRSGLPALNPPSSTCPPPGPRHARHMPLCPHSRAFSRTPHSAQLLCHVHLGCSHVFSGLSNIPPSGRTPVYLPITYGGASRSTPGFNNYKYALLFTGKSGGTPPALLSYG